MLTFFQSLVRQIAGVERRNNSATGGGPEQHPPDGAEMESVKIYTMCLMDTHSETLTGIPDGIASSLPVARLLKKSKV